MTFPEKEKILLKIMQTINIPSPIFLRKNRLAVVVQVF